MATRVVKNRKSNSERKIMSSHASSSAPPPPSPTTGSSGGKERVISAIKWMMFFIALITLAVGVSFSAGGLKIIGLVIAGLVGLVVLIGIMSGSSRGGAGGFVVLLVVAAVVGITGFFMQNQKMKRDRKDWGIDPSPAAVGVSAGGVVEKQLVAHPGTNYTSFTVGTGTNMWWIVEHPSESIMFHFDGGSLEHDQEDSKNGPAIRLPQMKREYTAHLRAKGIVSVPVKVYLTPIR